MPELRCAESVSSMPIAIVHFSDIHIRNTGNPLLSVVDQLIQAVNSIDSSVNLFVVVISGDIAFSGSAPEYRMALAFFKEFGEKLQKLRPGSRIEFVSIPGNHDSVLPESGTKLRKTLIQGVVPSMQEDEQDAALLAQLLKAQAPYNRFRKQLRKGSSWNGICESVLIEHEGNRGE